jgi:signal transduction histidine kinase/CheY-like chemotaxis protein
MAGQRTTRSKSKASVESDRRRLSVVLEGIEELISVVDPDTYELLHVNTAFERVWGEDVIGRKCYQVIQGQDAPCPFCTNDRIFGEHVGSPWVWEYLNKFTKRWYRCTDKAIRWIDGRMVRFELASDITNLKTIEESLVRSTRELEIRNRIAEVFLTVPDEQMYGRVLDIVLEALESRYGVFGYIDEDEALVVPTMTRDIWDQCQVSDKDVVFPRESWGDSSWPRALREKQLNYTNEVSTRTPAGHIPIARHVSLPIVHQGEPIGLIQVANKADDYSKEDIELLGTIGDIIAPVLKARLMREREAAARERAQADLKKNHEQLEAAHTLLQTEVAGRKRVEIELRRTGEELARQNWVKTGIVGLAEAIAGDPDVATLASRAITEVARYLDVQVATLFAPRSGGTATLTRLGSYALSGPGGPPSQIELGQGLAGQAALERRQILLRDVPGDYLKISSSLGGRIPNCICITPLVHQDRVKGVMEVGTLGELDEVRVAYLDQAAATLAIAIEGAHGRDALARSLEESQQLSEELQAQQEELKAANEELEEQTQRLRISEEALRVQQEELQVTNEELHEKNVLLERQKLEVEQARAAISEKAEELARASTYKSEFLANMSHELRTPLNSLLLLARSLADNTEGNLSDEQVESARVVYKSGNDLLALINDILDLSKVEAGHMDFRLEEVRVADLASSVRSAFQHLADAKALELTISVDGACPRRVVSDRRRVEQVITNLVANAIKFTDRGGVTVSFSAASPDAGLARRRLATGRVLAIAVRDTGIGIAPEQQKLIFEAFRQVDGGTSRRFGGTGLGLSISRELVHALGGEIHVSSAPGEGSTFTVFLPVDEVERDVAAIGEPGPERAGTGRPAAEGRPGVTSIPDDRSETARRNRSILLIEDDPSFAEILARQCHEQGFKILAAATGEDGIDLARRFVPRGILLDIRLPGIDGWRVLELLKEHPETRHIPVHIMSVDEPSAAIRRKGAIGHVQKPVTREQIGAALRKLEETATRQAKRVLVVEDDEAVRRGIVELIADGEVQVDEADGGGQAIAALRSNRYDCMVLDLKLWDFDGDELLRRIEKELGADLPPVIVYTARDLTWEEDLDLRSYSDSIIIKGVRSDERLLDEVSLFLHRVVAEMPEKKRQVITSLHDGDAMLRDKSVLLVDDDMRTLFALSRFLSERGMRVLKADNGEKAIAVLEESSDVDVVLMDIMMPVLDGYETMRRIRSQDRFRKLPIIALTAKAMKGDRERCMEAGASDYLPKPVDQDRLISMLRVWLYR